MRTAKHMLLENFIPFFVVVVVVIAHLFFFKQPSIVFNDDFHTFFFILADKHNLTNELGHMKKMTLISLKATWRELSKKPWNILFVLFFSIHIPYHALHRKITCTSLFLLMMKYYGLICFKANITAVITIVSLLNIHS